MKNIKNNVCKQMLNVVGGGGAWDVFNVHMKKKSSINKLLIYWFGCCEKKLFYETRNKFTLWPTKRKFSLTLPWTWYHFEQLQKRAKKWREGNLKFAINKNVSSGEKIKKENVLGVERNFAINQFPTHPSNHLSDIIPIKI